VVARLIRESETRSAGFQDDVGVSHVVPLEGTIAREQGLAALRHWMPRGEKLPGLVWGRA
jgi:hypothetical protein